MAKPKINLMPLLKKMADKHEQMESKGHEKGEKGGKKKGKGC